MKSLLVILGPTAVGKTKLSLKLAQKIDGEIISADSMQIYQDMDIGTAKVKSEIRKEIPHHMIDIITPEENFSVADFKDKTEKIIENIHSRNHFPLLVGGTGLYIKALIQGFMLPDMEINQDLREDLRDKADKYGNKYIHNILAEIDPKLAKKLHPNDIRRVIRGIEIYYQTGKTKSYYKYLQTQKPPRYQTLKIGLKRDRKKLYERINKRVDLMIEEGLVEEVKYLSNKYELSETALQALGYKELFNYLNDNYDLDEAIRLIKRNTRRFAKKQLTWFRRDDDIHWFNLSNLNWNQVYEQSLTLIKNKF